MRMVLHHICSREKLRPERELQRAENKILSCKFGIRDGIRELDVLCLEGSIDQSAFDAEGQIYHEEVGTGVSTSDLYWNK